MGAVSMRKSVALWSGIAPVVALAVLGIWLYGRMQLTPPTALGLDPANLAPLSPPTISPPVVAATQPSDASADYRQAWLDYQANTDPYDTFALNPSDPPPTGVALILVLWARRRRGLCRSSGRHRGLSGGSSGAGPTMRTGPHDRSRRAAAEAAQSNRQGDPIFPIGLRPGRKVVRRAPDLR